MSFQGKTKRILKNPIVFFIIFAFYFLGGCREPLFLSRGEEASQAASRDTVSKREKTVPLDKKGQVSAFPPSRRLKAVPLEEPFVLRTTDSDSTFPRGEKVVFTVPLNELNPGDQNQTFFIGKIEERSDLMVRNERAAFTIQLEEQSFRNEEDVFFTGQLEEQSFRGKEDVFFTGQLQEQSFKDEERVSFMESLEQPPQSLGSEVSFMESLEPPQSLEREVFFMEPLEESSSKDEDEIFFMKPLEERAFFMANETTLLNSSLQMVFFDTNSFILSEEGRRILDENVKWLKAYPYIGRIELEGHCDSLGSEAYNRNLGLKRAESVKEYLQSHGIPGERLVPVSYGEAAPLFDANTELNRRVSFVPID